jgi:tetratricopeptide (TPR) repeat protein
VAKKKGNREPSSKRQPADDPGGFVMPPSFDPRLMERMMRQAMRQQGIPDNRNPDLAAAEDLAFQAYEAEDIERRVLLARQAIEICPDCAEAFVCLAEVAPTAEAAETIYRMGVAAGESALGGADRLASYEGHFWSILETRPYLRARFGLAQALWANGKREEAIGECRELLRLNPEDNQGVRYELGTYCSDTGQDDLWQELLDQYPDDASADWNFSRALLTFRRQGDSPEACELLRQAHAANPHVAPLLLGSRLLPIEQPEFIEIGGQTEAVSYALQFSTAWRNAPGSLAWVRRTLRIALPDREFAPSISLRRLMAEVAELPQVAGQVWQVDVRRSKLGCADDLAGPSPWTLIVTCPESNDLLALGAMDGDAQPSAHETLLRVLEAMRDPREHEPHRPELLQVRRKTFAKHWQPKLEKLDIECQWVEELDHVEYVLERLTTVVRFSPRTAGSLEDHVGEMADLPLEPGEVWQADVRRVATWVTEDDVPQRPCATLVVSCTKTLVLAQQVSVDDPQPEMVSVAVMTAILNPVVGDPHLPGTIEVGSDEVCQLLAQHLAPLGVECRVIPVLDQLEFIYGEMEQGLASSDELLALIDTPGVTLDHVAGFFDAAAEFYRRQPWRHVAGDRLIRIHCSRFHTDTWYAVVMGQSGMTLGLAMYEDLELLQAILRADPDTDRRHAGMSVMFGEAFEISVRDLDAAEEHGWPIAGPEAYPLIMRVNPGMAVRPPLNWELELAEACLRAIPAFLNRQATTGEARMAVPTAAGELDLTLCWQD